MQFQTVQVQNKYACCLWYNSEVRGKLQDRWQWSIFHHGAHTHVPRALDADQIGTSQCRDRFKIGRCNYQDSIFPCESCMFFNRLKRQYPFLKRPWLHIPQIQIRREASGMIDDCNTRHNIEDSLLVAFGNLCQSTHCVHKWESFQIETLHMSA